MSLITDLVSFWELEEASGTRNDSHGTNHLADNNTVGSGSGKVGNCADFEKDNSEYLSIADNADLSTGDIDFTICCWFNLESRASGGGGARPLVVKSNNTNGAAANIEYALYVFDDDKIYFDVSNGSTVGEVGSTGTYTEGSGWVFVVAWHDAAGNTVNVQVDDGTPDTVSYSSGGSDTAFDLEIGRGLGSSRYMDGLIDQVGFWKRVLTSQERTDLYNGGNGLSYAAMAGATASSFTPPSRFVRGRKPLKFRRAA